MTILLSVLEYEASIGIKPQPEAPVDLKAMYDDLPMHSIVRRTAQNLVLATSREAITAAKMEAAQKLMKDNGRIILGLFLSYNLNSRILTPMDKEGMVEVKLVIM